MNGRSTPTEAEAEMLVLVASDPTVAPTHPPPTPFESHISAALMEVGIFFLLAIKSFVLLLRSFFWGRDFCSKTDIVTRSFKKKKKKEAKGQVSVVPK